MTYKHLAKPIGTINITNSCFSAGDRRRARKKCRHMCGLSLKEETEGGFQIEVNFIIQSNKYQK